MSAAFEIRKRVAMMKLGTKVALQFKFNTLFFTLVTPITLVIYFFLWKSIFTYTGEEVIRGYNLAQMVSYYALSMIVGFFIWSEVDRWMEEDVRRGFLTKSLLKPLTYSSQKLFFTLGILVSDLVGQAIPVLLIAFLFFGLDVAPLFNFVAFIISVLLALLLNFYFAYLIGLSAFWLKNITGIRRVKRILLNFLSGGMIPLTFFPLGLQKIFHFMPFEYIRFVPINIYLGTYTPMGVVIQLVIQLAWIIGCGLLIGAIWKRAYQQFAGVGV